MGKKPEKRSLILSLIRLHRLYILPAKSAKQPFKNKENFDNNIAYQIFEVCDKEMCHYGRLCRENQTSGKCKWPYGYCLLTWSDFKDEAKVMLRKNL